MTPPRLRPRSPAAARPGPDTPVRSVAPPARSREAGREAGDVAFFA